MINKSESQLSSMLQVLELKVKYKTYMKSSSKKTKSSYLNDYTDPPKSC
jgi:hypothetical protein